MIDKLFRIAILISLVSLQIQIISYKKVSDAQMDLITELVESIDLISRIIEHIF